MLRKIATVLALATALTAQELRLKKTPTFARGGGLRVEWNRVDVPRGGAVSVVGVSWQLVPAYPIVPGADWCIQPCGIYLWGRLKGCKRTQRQWLVRGVPAYTLPAGLTLYLQGAVLDTTTGTGVATDIPVWRTL